MINSYSEKVTGFCFVQNSGRSPCTTTAAAFWKPSSSSSSLSVVSPFEADEAANDLEPGGPAYTSTYDDNEDEFLELTWDNVEMVLDTMRGFLIDDGGNVIISEIDGPIVKLELQGACGTCPSSTQTLKMGLERGLKEKIPEIQEVIQAMPDGPPLDVEQIDIVLDGVRPFLDVAGGSIECDRIAGLEGIQPEIWLNMQGSSASLNSVKLEIAQRLLRHFMMSGLRIEWVEQ